MKKITTQTVDLLLEKALFGKKCMQISHVPYFELCNKNEWYCGYNFSNSIRVDVDGSYKQDTYLGTRRSFYREMAEMTAALRQYLEKITVQAGILAPCFDSFPLSIEKNNEDIYSEILTFLHVYQIRKNERAGVEVCPKDDFPCIEMIVEGDFRDASALCLFLPQEKVLVVPNHHFGITFFCQKPERAYTILKNIIKDSALLYLTGVQYGELKK